MNKYFLMLLTAVAGANIHAADQQMTDQDMAMQLAGQDMQDDVDSKVVMAMQMEEDSKAAIAMQDDGERKVAGAQKQQDKKPIHSLEYNANRGKQEIIIKQAIERGLHPDQCVIGFSPNDKTVNKHLAFYNDSRKETVLDYAFRKNNRYLIYYLLKKGATKINEVYYHTSDNPKVFFLNDKKRSKDIVIQYLCDDFLKKTNKKNPQKINASDYLENPQFILMDLALERLHIKKGEEHETMLPQIVCTAISNVGSVTGKVSEQLYKNLGKLGNAACLLIRAGAERDQICKDGGFFFGNGKNFEQSLKALKVYLKKPKKNQEKLLERFDSICEEMEIAKQEVTETQVGVKDLLADENHLRISALAKIVAGYLDDDIANSSIASEIESLKIELQEGLAQCEAHYQTEMRAEQDRARLERERIKELERKKQLEEVELFKKETGIDFDAPEQISIGNFNPDELSIAGFGDDFDGFGLSSNSHNGIGNSPYMHYQPMLLSADLNGMSQSSSSDNGLSNSSDNGLSNSNGSQSSSSNADWMRANSASQSSSSHNGLSNLSNNGSRAMHDDASHSSSSSDAPHGKGEKRKFDDEDNGNSSKRARTENGNSNSSSSNGS